MSDLKKNIEQRNDPLKVVVKDGLLSISIGVETLGHAIEFAPSLERYDEESGDFQRPVITDADVFAKEIKNWLEHEEEDGSTAIHKMLDSVAQTAIEQGATGIKVTGDGV